MKPFVFSADSHIMEPDDLFIAGLPPKLQGHAIRSEKEGNYLVTRTLDTVIHRVRLGQHREADLGDVKRRGFREIAPRLDDMEIEGIDAEVCFPSLGLWLYCVGDPEAEAASARIYNDWNDRTLSGHANRFVRCGMLPVLDFSNTLAELDYLASKGFTAAMLPAATPASLPLYNNERWDPIFARGAQAGIVFVLHTGTGLASVIVERGPGAAIVNYTNQMRDAQKSAMYLIAGGVLDRNPGARVAFIESGASWLVALAERLDEVEVAHKSFVSPKLGRMPSRIIDDQIWASFQHDRACIVAANAGLPGAKNVMWGSDYPHAEGTFPISRKIVDELFASISVRDETRRAILGENAARLFGLTPIVATSPTAVAA